MIKLLVRVEINDQMASMIVNQSGKSNQVVETPELRPLSR
jgi:hypothetical protein